MSTTLIPRRGLRALDRMQSDLLRTIDSGVTGLSAAAFVPDLDVIERDGNLVVRLDAPGMQKEDFGVELHRGMLAITGERQSSETREGDRHWHVERRHGAFRRVLTLPKGVDESAISANYENGVLEIVVQLPRETQPQRIPVA